MTAFGRGQSSAAIDQILVEIHSVNSRRLEIIVNLPGELTEFDPPLRKLIAGAISRGRVSVYVSNQRSAGRTPAFRVNSELAKELKAAYDELRESLGYAGEVDFGILAGRPEIIAPDTAPGDCEECWAGIQTATKEALSQLLAMKEKEGQNLRPSLEVNLDDVEETLSVIEGLAPGVLKKHKARLTERISEAFPGLGDNEERVLREIALLADRLDISEEIARLRSHMKQFGDLLDAAEPAGRTLQFLLQEMNREINTIGSKANDLAISREVVRGKAAMEKLREQANNLE